MEYLKNEWDTAAEKIDCDPMRPIRYGMALRYMREMHKNIKILEVGCGEGTGLTILHEFGFTDISGVEVSPERIVRARRKIPSHIEVKEISTDSLLPYESGTFDVVISLGVIEHTLSPNIFINEIGRVLKDSGYAIISSDCLTWNFMQLLGLYKSDQPIDKAMTISHFRKLYRDNGFRMLHFDTFHLPERKSPLFSTIKLIIGKILRLCLFIHDKNKTHQADSVDDTNQIAMQVGNSSINNSPDYRRKKAMLNLIDDENIFLVKKTSSEGTQDVV